MFEPIRRNPCHQPRAASGSTRTERMCDSGMSRWLRSDKKRSNPSTSRCRRESAIETVTIESPCYSDIPTALSMNAYLNARSRSTSYRPDEPPCPPAMLIFRYSGLLSVFIALSFATHFDGSQYITCESLSDVVTSIHG